MSTPSRGERRILKALEEAGPRWTSVGRLHLELGYSRRFVQDTAADLYWSLSDTGLKILRTFYKGDWWYVLMEQHRPEEARGKPDVLPYDQECTCGGQLRSDSELEDRVCADCRQDEAEDPDVPLHGYTQDGEGCGIVP